MVLLFGAGTLMAQDNEAAKKKMLEIKLNEDFIFGEGNSDDKELAYGDALDDLLIFANELKSMNSQEQIKMNDLITNVQTIVYEEGSRYEVLVYIPFKIVIDTNRQYSSAKEEIGLKEESPEEIVVQIVEEEIPVVETQPLPVEPQPEVTAVSEKIEVLDTPLPVVDNRQESDMDVEAFLITQENFSEIKSYLSEMKRSGKIKETGAVEGLSGLPQDASLIMIDELGGILSVLSPVNGGVRTNYKTKKSDSEKNYNSKFVVWYRK